MSFTTISRCAADRDFQQRVESACHREAIMNAELGDTDFGRQLLGQSGGIGSPGLQALYWNVAVDVEVAYESGIQAGRGAPGFDADVITDASITAAIQAHWPPDVATPGPPTP